MNHHIDNQFFAFVFIVIYTLCYKTMAFTRVYNYLTNCTKSLYSHNLSVNKMNQYLFTDLFTFNF